MDNRYTDATKDAAAIAAEVVTLGYSSGWSGDVRIAAAVEAKLVLVRRTVRTGPLCASPGME